MNILMQNPYLTNDKWHIIWLGNDMLDTWYGDREKDELANEIVFASNLSFDSLPEAVTYALSKVKNNPSIRLNWKSNFPNIDHLE